MFNLVLLLPYFLINLDMKHFANLYISNFPLSSYNFGEKQICWLQTIVEINKYLYLDKNCQTDVFFFVKVK